MFILAPSEAAVVTRMHDYLGNERSQWKVRNALRSVGAVSTSSANSILYAGGDYPVSIVKMAEDGAGNTYVIGNWLVANRIYPSYAPPATLAPAQSAIFVSKIDPTGAIVYQTHLGGKGNDLARGIAVDSTGNVYGVGNTSSPDFPLQHAVQTVPGSSTTGFVFKLDSSGELVWSTYFGGNGLDYVGSSVNSVAADTAGNAYVTGTSDQANLMTTPGAFQTNAAVFGDPFPDATSSAFVAKFSSSGALVYSTWLGGHVVNCYGGSGCLAYQTIAGAGPIAVDSAGNAYVAGQTNTIDFPTTPGAFQTSCNCPQYYSDGFLTKLNPSGTGLVYSTYISGAAPSVMLIDSSGKAYIAGTAIPTGPSSRSVSQIFVAAFNSTGSALAFSTSVGGATGVSAPNGLALDSGGRVFMSGTTKSATFPNSLPAFPGGQSFFLELSPDLTKVLSGIRLPAGTADADVAVDPSSGNVLVAGSSGDLLRLGNLNASPPPILGVGNAANQSVDGAVAPQELVSIYGIGIGPQQPVTAQPAAGVFPTSLGGVQVFFNDHPAPLLYVSAHQINTVVSDNPSVTFGPETVRVVLNSVQVAQLALPLTANMPGVFHNADGTAAALNHDGTINSITNPARSGSTISIWGTGVIALTLCCVPAAVEVGTPGTLPGPVLEPLHTSYAGPAPGLIAGVFQINVQLPQSPYPLWLQVLADGILSPPVLVYLGP